MERLYCQGVVAQAFSLADPRGKYQMDRLRQQGLRPRVTLGSGRMAIKGFNARGVSIALTMEPAAVREKLDSVANNALVLGGQLGRRQQILDSWVKEQNNDN